MSSQPATMADDAASGAAPLPRGLPDELLIWEILVRLPPKSLLRCRAVCRAWRLATSTRDFLLAHHAHQPSLPILSGEYYHNILAFDNRAATDGDQLHVVAQFDESFRLEASCDGMLVLSKLPMAVFSSPCLLLCNPATRELAPLGPQLDFDFSGMYPHRPTGEYRLLLGRMICNVLKDQNGFYVFALGSDQPPRYVGWPQTASRIFHLPVRVRDSLHWYPVDYHSGQCQWESKLIVFDTIAESFRQMRAPIVPTNSSLFDMDDTLGIYTHNYSTGIIDIWVLQNYGSEVWDLKYRIKLPVAEIRMKFIDYWGLSVAWVDGGVHLLVKVDEWMLHIDSDGKLVNSFYRHRRGLSISDCQLKQSLVQHTFFPALEGYVVNASPFIGPVE